MQILRAGQMYDTVFTQPTPLKPLGYFQSGSLTTVLTLPSPPADAHIARITAEGNDVRYRDDGVDPTPTLGMPLAKGTEIIYAGDMSLLKFIAQTGSAKINVSYYT